MQPLDRTHSRDSASPRQTGERPSAQIIRLDDWRRKRLRQGFRWRKAPPGPVPVAPPRNHPVPIEAWLMMLVIFSAVAGAIFALMGLGYLP